MNAPLWFAARPDTAQVHQEQCLKSRCAERAPRAHTIARPPARGRLRAGAGPLMLVLAACAVADAPGSPAAADVDWTPRERLAAAAAARLPRWCEGAYVAPPLPADAGTGPVENQPLHAEGDRASYVIGERATISGNVDLQRGVQQLHTDAATWFVADDRVELNGSVQVREPGLLMQGERAQVDLGADAARLEQATFVLHEDELRGRAAALARTPDGLLHAESGEFTRCPPGDDSWNVRTGAVTVDRERGFATARNARVRVGGVPVFYAPWLRFPLGDERQTGFLFPGIGYSNEKGLDLTLPYYLNLAPNYDATLSPRVLTNRGFLLEGEFRHLSRRSYNEIGAAWLPQDDDYNGKFTRADFEDLGMTGEFDPADRWLVHWGHTGRWLGRHNVRTFVDYTEISDADYFRDLGTDLSVTSRADLERSAEVRYDRPGLAVRLQGQYHRPQCHRRAACARRTARQRAAELAVCVRARHRRPAPYRLHSR